jgi:methyl-accepting chemotaxis protein
MIALIQHETEQAIQTMEKHNQKVKKGIDFTKEADEAFLEIKHSIENVTLQVDQVSPSIDQFDSLGREMIRSIEEVKQVA